MSAGRHAGGHLRVSQQRVDGGAVVGHRICFRSLAARVDATVKSPQEPMRSKSASTRAAPARSMGRASRPASEAWVWGEGQGGADV